MSNGEPLTESEREEVIETAREIYLDLRSRFDSSGPPLAVVFSVAAMIADGTGGKLTLCEIHKNFEDYCHRLMAKIAVAGDTDNVN